MTVTLNDSKPIGLCVATEELFDTKRFLLNYCDGLIMMDKDLNLKNKLVAVKRELNSFNSQHKFFQGSKAIILSNMDKIIGLVASRYPSAANPQSDRVVADGKAIIGKILNASNFDDIAVLEAEFKGKITLPTYKLFISNLRKSSVDII